MDYYNLLELLHKEFKPKKYLEVGIRNGDSLSLADGNTFCIGIDPAYHIKAALSDNTYVFKMTSDAFFEKYSENGCLASHIDMAFIDGMHLFEYVLRDFINIEKRCASKDSFIVLHDTVPRDKVTSERNRTTNFWTGDVFKIILILKKYRPDLKIYNADAAPTGLTIVSNLDSSSDILFNNYEKIVNEYVGMDFDNLGKDVRSELGVEVADIDRIKSFFYT